MATEANAALAQEQLMLRRVLDAAKEFYQDPKNLQAFEAWKKQKEATQHAS